MRASYPRLNNIMYVFHSRILLIIYWLSVHKCDEFMSLNEKIYDLDNHYQNNSRLMHACTGNYYVYIIIIL